MVTGRVLEHRDDLVSRVIGPHEHAKVRRAESPLKTVLESWVVVVMPGANPLKELPDGNSVSDGETLEVGAKRFYLRRPHAAQGQRE